MARSREEDHGHKRSSSSRHDKAKDRHNDDDRHDKHRKQRHGASTKPEKTVTSSSSSGNAKPAAPSATMDAFMRMVTGKEERTIADRISDPNRPTWEQYKKDNAEKLDMSGTGEKEMLAYRKKLDAAREKALARRDGSKKKKKKRRSHSSSSESDGSSDDDDRSSRKKSRKKKKSSRKRRRHDSSDSDASSDSDSDASSSRKSRHKAKKKHKRHSKSREASPSPVRLSSFFQGANSDGVPHARAVLQVDHLRYRRAVSVVDAIRDRRRMMIAPPPSSLPPPSASCLELNAAATATTADQRHAFLLLLRQGIQLKLQHQMQQHKRSSSIAMWQTLHWRDAFSMAPFFEETIGGRPLRIKQLLQGELNGLGTGLTVWPAACMLLKHLEHRFTGTRRLESQFVIELGSGTGAVGIAAAMLGAGRVVVTDMSSGLFLMEANAAIARANTNGHLTLEVEAYEWGTVANERIIPRASIGEDASYPSLILISDCILPRLYPIEPLVQALEMLARPHTTILISYEHRYYEHFDAKLKFWDLLQAAGFTIRVIEEHEYHPQYRAPDIEIWEAKRL